MALRDMFDDIDTKVNQFEEQGFIKYEDYLKEKSAVQDQRDYYKMLEEQGQEEEVSS